MKIIGYLDENHNFIPSIDISSEDINNTIPLFTKEALEDAYKQGCTDTFNEKDGFRPEFSSFKEYYKENYEE